MNADPIFRVSWTPLADVKARAEREGIDWDNPSDSLVDVAFHCGAQEDFRVYRLARRAAIKRAKECFWGTARIHEVTRDVTGCDEESSSFQEFCANDKKMARIETR